MARLIALSKTDVEAIFGIIPAQLIAARAIEYRGDYLATGLIVRLPDDARFWAVFDTQHMTPQIGAKTVRAVNRFLHEFNQDVFIQCDGPFAARFLKLLGFRRTMECRNDVRTNEPKEVWLWQRWPL